MQQIALASYLACSDAATHVTRCLNISVNNYNKYFKYVHIYGYMHTLMTAVAKPSNGTICWAKLQACCQNVFMIVSHNAVQLGLF